MSKTFANNEGYLGAFYGPLDINDDHARDTLVHPLTNAKVASGCRWNSHLQDAAHSKLITAEDIYRSSMSKNFWEWLCGQTGAYSPKHTIFPNENYERIGTWIYKSAHSNYLGFQKRGSLERSLVAVSAVTKCSLINEKICHLSLSISYPLSGELFFDETVATKGKAEIDGLKEYYNAVGNFEGLINIIRSQVSAAEHNADICLLCLNLKANIPSGSNLNRIIRICCVALNITEFIHRKWQRQDFIRIL